MGTGFGACANEGSAAVPGTYSSIGFLVVRGGRLCARRPSGSVSQRPAPELGGTSRFDACGRAQHPTFETAASSVKSEMMIPEERRRQWRSSSGFLTV
eukprot:5324059-Prymnesium_polylepis.1